MIPKTGITPKYVKEALLRRRWYVVLPFFIIFSYSIYHCIVTPRTFRSQTLILVEPQKVPGEYVRSTITVDLRDRLRTISQQIKSRSRLEQVIKQYDLYSQTRSQATMTDAVEAFRRAIEIDVAAGGQAFEVAYVGPDPETVKKVTDTIANLFIEDNLKYREVYAAGTSRFLNRELDKAEETLREKETAIREFKQKYRGFLPDDMEQNNRMVTLLQQQLDSLNTTAEQMKDRKVLMETQLQNLQRMETEYGGTEPGGFDLWGVEGEDAGGLASPELESLRNQLKGLRTRYSDKHPDVIRLQAMIAKLEKENQAASNEQDSDEAEEESGETAIPSVSLFDTQREELKTQIQTIARDIEELKKEKAAIKEKMDTIVERIQRGPEVEQMLNDLSRGYTELDQNYQSLLQKKFKAGLAENLERAQKGEQFTILDAARIPEKPFAPNSRRVLALGFLFSLGAGLGLGFLREYFDSNFFSYKELERAVGIPVIVSIPRIMIQKDVRKRKFKTAVSILAMASMAFVLVYGLYYLWKMDPMLRFTS